MENILYINIQKYIYYINLKKLYLSLWSIAESRLIRIISRRVQHQTEQRDAPNDAIEVHRPSEREKERSREKKRVREREGRPDVRPLLLLCRRHASGTKRVSVYHVAALGKRRPSSFLSLPFRPRLRLRLVLSSGVVSTRFRVN